MSWCRIDEAFANPFYDGSLDHDTSRWLNDSYLSTCFDEFNTRFFQGILSKPVLHCCSKTEEDFEDGLGVTVYDFVDCFGTPCDEVDLSSIKQGDVFRYVRGVFLRNDVKWSSRFQFENALIHEMCHVYQNDIVLKRDLHAIVKDSETSLRRNQKDRFHGDAFLGIAKKVSNNPENEEWFEVTPYVLGDEIIRDFRMFRDTNDSDKTHRDSKRYYEVTSRDIPNLSDRRSYARSRSSNIVARFVDFNKETGEVHYSVTSQEKAGKSYTVTFRFKNWNPDMDHLDDEIQHAVKSDIEIDCTCPAFTYQGYKFIASVKGGSVDIERRPPNETNPDRHGYACKHILKSIDSFNQDFDKFRAEGKGMIKKHNLRVQHKYENRKVLEAKNYSLSEMLDMQLLTYCDEVLGIHLVGLKSQSVLESISSAFLSYMEQIMDLDGIDLGETYDDFRKCISQGRPLNNVSVDSDTQDAFDKIVKKLKRHFDTLQGGVFDVKEARGGATGHFPTGVRIDLDLINDSGVGIWSNTLNIPLYLCFAPTGKLRLLSLEQVKTRISDWIVDEVQNISDDWDRMRRNFESKRPRRSRSMKRFESRSMDAYNEIENDLSSFIDEVQAKFKAFCKKEFHFKRVPAYIDIEDGLESDDGTPTISVTLWDRRISKYDSLLEVIYSFDGDEINDDRGSSVGETVEDLITDIVSRFASEYDNMNSL